MPNDNKLRIEFTFQGSHIYLRELNLVWGVVPKVFRIDCYTDQ